MGRTNVPLLEERESIDCGRGSEKVNPVGHFETNVIYRDDNLRRLADFPPECIDLIYLDPPFFSNKIMRILPAASYPTAP